MDIALPLTRDNSNLPSLQGDRLHYPQRLTMTKLPFLTKVSFSIMVSSCRVATLTLPTILSLPGTQGVSVWAVGMQQVIEPQECPILEKQVCITNGCKWPHHQEVGITRLLSLSLYHVEMDMLYSGWHKQLFFSKYEAQGLGWRGEILTITWVGNSQVFHTGVENSSLVSNFLLL